MARKWTDKELISIAKSCDSRRTMRNTHSAALLQIYRRKLADVAFSHMQKERQYESDGLSVKVCSKCKCEKGKDLFYTTSRGTPRSICKTCSDIASSKWRHENIEKSRDIVNRSARSNPEKVRIRSKRKRELNPHVFAARDMLKRILSLTGKRKTTKTECHIGYSFNDLKSHIEKQFQEGMSWNNWGEWHIDHIDPVSSMVARGITDPKEINALSNMRPLWAKDNLSRGRKCQMQQ